MDEELDDERRSRISRYNADGGHYTPRRLRYELSARPKALVEAEAQKEQKAHGQVRRAGSAPQGYLSCSGCNYCRAGESLNSRWRIEMVVGIRT